jgi:hypothetical protein
MCVVGRIVIAENRFLIPHKLITVLLLDEAALLDHHPLRKLQA